MPKNDLVLASISRAQGYLVNAKTAIEGKEVLAMSEAALVFGKRMRANCAAMNAANVFHMKAKRRLGQILANAPKAKGTKGTAKGKNSSGGIKLEPPEDETPTLSELGISKKTSSRAQILAAIPEEQFEAALVVPEGAELLHSKAEGALIRNLTAKSKKEEAAKIAKEIARKLKANPAPLVYHESFAETAKRIDVGSVALIFTDPPYDTESVPLYGELATVANRVLIDGGSLICYCGHRLIPKVIEQMQPSGLSFYWILACIHSGKSARMPLTGQIVTWKPMLWWVKGKDRRDTSVMLEDSVRSDAPDKETHEWQQGITEALYYIDKLTAKGELVFDPFCGGGTTVVAARQLGRLTIACDSDAKAVSAACERLAKEGIR